MNALSTLLLLVTLVAPALSLADSTAATSSASALSSPSPEGLLTCPASSERDFVTAQVSQSDCCKGHKGVCGCRAGKIVCCDNTTSTNCTCHGDQGLAN